MVLGELVIILDAAITLQPETELVMRVCLGDASKDATLARQAGRLTSTLLYLVGRAEALPASAIVDEAHGLLRYHHRLLAETVDFAYSGSAMLNRRSAPYFSGHLGEPAARLSRLRNVAAGYLTDDPGNGSGPAAGQVQLGHSLRTPLTTILGNAASLLQPDVDWDRESENRLLRGIATESSRLARAVDNILNLAAMSAGTLRPDFGWCDPSALIRAAVGGIDARLSPEGRIHVATDLPGTWSPHGVLWADHTLLTRALGNVVDNALRHTRPNTGVTLAAAADAEHLMIVIADDGPGLPPRVTTAIAQSAATGPLPTEVGTGIPTAIGLVVAHGGTAKYPSTEVGTRCVIRLPVTPGHPNPRRSESGRPDL